MKSGMQTYFFLASYALRDNVLVLVVVKKIWEKFIPYPDFGVKRAPDAGSATLQ
jgi:hypothetical protein